MADTCFDGIVGVSEGNGCFPGMPAECQISAASLWVDELVSLNKAQYVDQTIDVWDIIKKEIEKSEKHVHTAILNCLDRKATRRYASLDSRTIGECKAGSAYYKALGSNYHGIQFYLDDIRGGEYTFDSFATHFDTEVTDLDVFLYESDSEFIDDAFDADLIQTFTISSTARRTVWHTFTPETLQRGRAYWLVYEAPAGVKVGLCKGDCGCGSVRKCSWDFLNGDAQIPCPGLNPKYPWSAYIKPRGVEGEDIADVTSFTTCSSAQWGGMMLKMSFTCKPSGFCTDSLDFQNDSVARLIAESIWYKAAFNTLASLRYASNISAYLEMDKKNIVPRMEELSHEYESRMTYLCQTLSKDEITRFSDCHKCRQQVVGSSI